jgi:hypothetical protein
MCLLLSISFKSTDLLIEERREMEEGRTETDQRLIFVFHGLIISSTPGAKMIH